MGLLDRLTSLFRDTPKTDLELVLPRSSSSLVVRRQRRPPPSGHFLATVGRAASTPLVSSSPWDHE